MNNEIQFILYQLPDDEGKIQVVIKDETIWATQKAMAQLFDVGVPDISKHLKKKFETGELDKEVVVSKMEIATPHGAIDGKTQMSETAFYNLDAIIAVGYRVSSARATKFRKWATKVLTEYIKNGFVLDEERLKPARQPLRLSIPVPTIQKITWACRRGRMRPMVVFCSATQR